MKELSVAVLGGGRWARALMGLLVQNQRKARGTIKRVSQYVPPRADPLGSALRPNPSFAPSDDATMMGALGPSTLWPRALQGGQRRRDDDGRAGSTASRGMPQGGQRRRDDDGRAPAAGRGMLKADSDDATMMGALGPAGGRGMLKADSDDATMMGVAGR